MLGARTERMFVKKVSWRGDNDETKVKRFAATVSSGDTRAALAASFSGRSGEWSTATGSVFVARPRAPEQEK
jgi:hypothetical protein